MLRVLNMICNFLLVPTVFGRLFIDPDPDFLADPDPDSGKKSDPDPDKRTLIRNTE